MKLQITKSNIIQTVVALYILLFTYATVSKVLDFHNFQIQLGQSPLLSAFADWVAVIVPLVEFVIVLLLLSNKSRLLGLYGSFALMTMFTAYIVIILNFSSFTPCSCGGILEEMTWTQHLVFNIVFVALSGLAILSNAFNKFVIGYLSILATSAIGLVVALFLMSEDIIQHRNNFIRRLPAQFSKQYEIDLGYNSYYFAGLTNGKIYLGNTTAPLLLTEIDTSLKNKKELVVKLNNLNLPFRSLQLQVHAKNFYASDGTVPAVFHGKTGLWYATQIPQVKSKFSNPVFTDSTSFAFRKHKANAENVLARFDEKQNKTITNPTILQKQVDGIFDTDGILNYDPNSNLLVYLYYYRNQYIVCDSKLNIIHRGNTIDTISKAQIKVAFNKDRNEKKLSAPPLTVNKNAYLHRGLLFVNSSLMGKFEDEKMWRQASLIDIYDIKNRSYIVSFYVYNIEGKRLSRFAVEGNTFYGIVGRHLVSYKMSYLVHKRPSP